MCSIPQKQPAATVAVCAPSGIDIAGAGASPAKYIVDVVNGRIRRWMSEAMMRPPNSRRPIDIVFLVLGSRLTAIQFGIVDMESNGDVASSTVIDD